MAGSSRARPISRAALSRRTLLRALASALTLPAARLAAKPADGATGRIALIIDDLGNNAEPGERAAALDGPVACAILPHTPYAKHIARRAHEAGKEVLLHLPLQAVADGPDFNPGSIHLDNTQAQMRRILDVDLDAVPHIVGVNNHMGSLLTRHPGHMQWLMAELKQRGNLYFIDSYTTAGSVALQIAREHGIPAARRDVFLDNVREAGNIGRAFERLQKLAQQRGTAIGIGHPHAETLAFLESMLPALAARGLELVPVNALLDRPSR